MVLTEKPLKFETISSYFSLFLSLQQVAKHVLCRKVWSRELLGLLQPNSHAYLAARGALKTLRSLLDVVLLASYQQLSMRQSPKIHARSQNKTVQLVKEVFYLLSSKHLHRS